MPEEKQAHFQQTYTVLIAFLSLVLPPVITQGVDEVSTTDHEAALGEQLTHILHSLLHKPQAISLAL